MWSARGERFSCNWTRVHPSPIGPPLSYQCPQHSPLQHGTPKKVGPVYPATDTCQVHTHVEAPQGIRQGGSLILVTKLYLTKRTVTLRGRSLAQDHNDHIGGKGTRDQALWYPYRYTEFNLTLVYLRKRCSCRWHPGLCSARQVLKLASNIQKPTHLWQRAWTPNMPGPERARQRLHPANKHQHTGFRSGSLPPVSLAREQAEAPTVIGSVIWEISTAVYFESQENNMPKKLQEDLILHTPTETPPLPRSSRPPSPLGSR